MRRAMEYWECPQQLADRCARGGALCTARRSPAIPYRRTAFFGQKLPIPPSSGAVLTEGEEPLGVIRAAVLSNSVRCRIHLAAAPGWLHVNREAWTATPLLCRSWKAVVLSGAGFSTLDTSPSTFSATSLSCADELALPASCFVLRGCWCDPEGAWWPWHQGPARPPNYIYMSTVCLVKVGS